MNNSVTKPPSVSITTDGRDITVEKVYTRNGQRLKITAECGGSSILIDALGLESISWQSIDALADRFGGTVDSGNPQEFVASEASEPDVTKQFNITNEFAHVDIGTVAGARQTLLRIEAPKLGYKIDIPAPILERIAGLDSDVFTKFLETPYGPEGDDH